MKTIDLIQGSADWLAHRAQHFNASDAPAMLGCSPYMTRTELLARMKTGITQDVDAGTQRRFDDGHRFEALARPLAEQIIGEELSPVTGTNGQLSASFDGLTFMGDTAFEHKTLGEPLRYTPWDEGNGYHLPLHYQVQMEQQLLVSGAERVLFMATKWVGDTLTEERHCWYASDAALRAKIVAGWAQFAKDLVEFTPEVKAAPVVAEAVESLPAVSVRMDGAIAVVSNLDLFGVKLRAYIDRIEKKPSTDQEFANCESAVKALKTAEQMLDQAESAALAQIDPVESMRRTVADYKALASTTRLMIDKLVKARKESMKAEIVASGVSALAKHIRELNAAMPADYMPTVPTDFGGAIKGLRTIDSITNAVDTELARAKIQAGEVANRIHANVKTLQASGLVMHDTAALVLKAPDDLVAVIAQRVAAEKAKEEAQRERIRAEEAARLEREAEAARKVREAAEEMARKREQEEAERLDRERKDWEPLHSPEVVEQLVAQNHAPLEFNKISDTASKLIAAGAPMYRLLEKIPEDNGARLTLGAINERIAPISISVAGLSTLGFDPVEQVKASRFYRECDLPAICRAIADHAMAAATQAAPMEIEE